MTFIQYVFGVRSMCQTIKEIETNVAYRWFLGFGFYTEVPHFSTFGKNYERCLKDTDVFKQIFYRILKEIADQGLLSADHVFIDSTHVKASANTLMMNTTTAISVRKERYCATQHLRRKDTASTSLIRWYVQAAHCWHSVHRARIANKLIQRTTWKRQTIFVIHQK